MRLGVIGLDPQGLLEVLDGFLDLSRSCQSDPQIVVRVGEIGLDPQGLLVMLDGVLDLTRLRQSHPQIGVRVSVIRVDLQRVLILFDCLLEVACPQTRTLERRESCQPRRNARRSRADSMPSRSPGARPNHSVRRAARPAVAGPDSEVGVGASARSSPRMPITAKNSSDGRKSTS